MPPVTQSMLKARREKDCTAITLERKYYDVDGSFVKRSLRPSEWQHNHINGTLYIPRFGNERLLNEAASLRFLAEKTHIPVPKLYACFEDDGAVYLIREHVEGVAMASLSPEQRKTVQMELEEHLETLRSLKSRRWGGPSGLVIPPYRIMVRTAYPEWNMKPRESEDLVFCHNDFSTHNVIVDPTSLKIKAIIDWEYAGFYPPEFEGLYFRRPGPSVALDGENNDEDRLLAILEENREEDQ